MQLRQVAGHINANGDIVSGTGDFATIHRATGHYQIVFEPQLKRIVSAVATQIFPPDGSTLDNTVIIHISNEECFLHTGGSSGSDADRDFCFIAVGEA